LLCQGGTPQKQKGKKFHVKGDYRYGTYGKKGGGHQHTTEMMVAS